MSNKKLTILAVIAAFMVVWAVAQSRLSSRRKAEPDRPVYLIQGLDPDDIAGIVLGTGENAVTLKRQGKHFVVTNKDNYPAAVSEINELITKCLDIRTVELVTDDKANHKDLGVVEEDAQNVIKFLRPDSSLLTGIVIGKTKQQGGGVYVRLVSSDKVYVTLERPWISDRVMNYIDQELIAINRDDIESVTVSGPNGYTLKTEKDGTDIILENLPVGKKLKANVAKSVFSALVNLRFDDVKRESTAKDELNFDRHFVCRLKDSTVYTVKIAQKDDKTYVTCDAEFTDKAPVTKEKTVESEEELRKKEAKLLAKDKANSFSAKHAGWVYEIPDYKAGYLVKELFELLEDEQKPQQAGDPNSGKERQ